MNEATKSEPSVGDLLGSLATATGTLVRQEIHLASTEMGAKARSAALDLGTVGVGGALAHAGLLSLIAGIILVLGTRIPMWVSALSIGAVAVLAGYVLIRRGLHALRAIDPVPQRAIQSLKRDTALIEEPLR